MTFLLTIKFNRREKTMAQAKKLAVVHSISNYLQIRDTNITNLNSSLINLLIRLLYHRILEDITKEVILKGI